MAIKKCLMMSVKKAELTDASSVKKPHEFKRSCVFFVSWCCLRACQIDCAIRACGDGVSVCRCCYRTVDIKPSEVGIWH